jgi:hypothetical protein
MPQEFGLHRLPDHELKRLLRALHRDVFTGQITRSSLIEKAFGHIEAHLDLIVGRDVPGAKAVVIAALAERDGVRGQGAQLVYCGPAAAGTRSRDFLDQVRDLIASATKSIEVYGLCTTDDRALLRTLGALMSGRDVKVRLVFDAKDLDEPVETVRRHVTHGFGSYGALEVFASLRASFRARVVVVDEAKVWVSSGELTTHEEDGFIDIGVVFSDTAYQRALQEEWKRLVAVGACVLVLPAGA